ncbi:MAG TPA: hypothetical protein VF647_23360 [Longimicrobium sp.]|jgi:hypothetical protein
MNQTFEERLLRKHEAEPLEGHTVVVFERAGDLGEKFHCILPSGTPMQKEGFLRRTLGPRKEYVAYAVTAAPELYADFSRHVVLSDHAHEFDLLFNLCYYVDDARLLVTTRTNDPLGSVCRKVGDVISALVCELPWNSVWHSFRASVDTVIHDNLSPLRKDAARFGIGIRSIGVDLQLPESETKTIRTVDRGITDLELTRELKLAEIENEEILARRRRQKDISVRGHAISAGLEIADLEDQEQEVSHRRGLREGRYEAEREAIRTVGGAVRNAAEYRNTFHGPRGLTAGEGGGSHPPTLLSPGKEGASSPPVPRGDRLAAVVIDLAAATSDVHPTPTKNAIRSSLLHLVAEVLADGTSDEIRRDQYAHRARTLVSSLHPVPGDVELNVLNNLMDPTWLQNALGV